MSAQTPLALDQLLDGLTTAIADWVRPSLGLVDAHSGKPTPPDHYAQTCAALALCSPIKGNTGKRDAALAAWMSTPEDEIDHLPFNRLALHLMRTLFADQFDTLQTAKIQAGIKRCRLRTRYPSNNWTLLATTCTLLEAAPAARPRHARTMARMIQRWTTTKGAFIDYPSNPRTAICTPLAYHHKALFLGALALRFCADDELATQTCRLFDWLVHCWDDAGYAGGFGRTTHALFGDACLIAALILLGLDESGPIDAIAQRLHHQLRPDGFLWLDPWGPTEGTKHWDDYMHLSVYNAWAAATLHAAREIRARYPAAPQLQQLRWQANRPGLFHDEEAGLASWRDGAGDVILFSTTGQPPQSPTRGVVELRYSGGRIYHCRIGSSHPLMHPGYRGVLSALECAPNLAEQSLILHDGVMMCAVDTFCRAVLTPTSAGFSLDLCGQAHKLAPSLPGSFLGRILAAIDWRLLNGRLGRMSNLKRKPITKYTALITIKLYMTEKSLTVLRKLRLSPLSHESCVNPPSHHFKLMQAEKANSLNEHRRANYVYQQTQTYDVKLIKEQDSLEERAPQFFDPFSSPI